MTRLSSAWLITCRMRFFLLHQLRILLVLYRSHWPPQSPIIALQNVLHLPWRQLDAGLLGQVFSQIGRCPVGKGQLQRPWHPFHCLQEKRLVRFRCLGRTSTARPRQQTVDTFRFIALDVTPLLPWERPLAGVEPDSRGNPSRVESQWRRAK